jgi:hypothetical protein
MQLLEMLARRFLRRVIKDRRARETYLERYYLVKPPRMPDGSYPFRDDGTPRDGIIWAEGWGYVLHHFRRGDEARETHSHPWAWCASIILVGGYREERLRLEWPEVRVRVLRPGSVNFLRHDDFHRVDLLDEERGCWTLFVHGPKMQGWGFLDRDTREFTPWREFISRARASSPAPASRAGSPPA